MGYNWNGGKGVGGRYQGMQSLEGAGSRRSKCCSGREAGGQVPGHESIGGQEGQAMGGARVGGSKGQGSDHLTLLPALLLLLARCTSGQGQI